MTNKDLKLGLYVIICILLIIGLLSRYHAYDEIMRTQYAQDNYEWHVEQYERNVREHPNLSYEYPTTPKSLPIDYELNANIMFLLEIIIAIALFIFVRMLDVRQEN